MEYSTLKEPMLWIYKIVGVKKQNGSPCRTVEMQRLNNAPLCLKKPCCYYLPVGSTVPQFLLELDGPASEVGSAPEPEDCQDSTHDTESLLTTVQQLRPEHTCI